MSGPQPFDTVVQSVDQASIDQLIAKMEDDQESEAFRYSNQLAKIGTDYVMEKMTGLLYAENPDTKYLAARTLAKTENNAAALEPLLLAINDKRNERHNGGMVEALEGFDVSSKFVEIFKLYLFGGLKVSAMAKRLLDYKEFDITPRVVRKAEKHWSHYAHNTPHDEAFELKKQEIDALLQELKTLLED